MQTCNTEIAVLRSSEVIVGNFGQSSLLQLMQAHEGRMRSKHAPRHRPEQLGQAGCHWRKLRQQVGWWGLAPAAGAGGQVHTPAGRIAGLPAAGELAAHQKKQLCCKSSLKDIYSRVDWQEACAAEAAARVQEPGGILMASPLWRRTVHESSQIDVTESLSKRTHDFGDIPLAGLAGAARAEGEVRMPVGQQHARMVGHACDVSRGVVM